MKRTLSLGWDPSSIQTTAVVWTATLALLATPATVGAIGRIDARALEANETTSQPEVSDSESATTYAYFRTGDDSGRLVKVDLTTLQRGAISLPRRERQLVSEVIDSGGTFAYFGRSASPAGTVKIGPGGAAIGSSTTNCGTTERVSLASDGTEGDNSSFGTAVTPDGRLVAFGSAASNLVANDTNEVGDIFVHDRETSITERVSVAPDGGETDAHSFGPAISADGRYVAFLSLASNLVPDDTNSEFDIFVVDRNDGSVDRVSVSSDGTEGNGRSVGAAISDDGRFVAFESTASNLVVNDTNEANDVFVHDRETGITERVSVASDGSEGSGGFGLPVPAGVAISGDGHHIAFYSDFTNLVPGDTNFAFDVFVHDRVTGVTERVSTDSDGNQGTGGVFAALPAISADGRFVAFNSVFSNLVPGDTNGHIDVFVHDRETGVTERVSVASDGTEGDHPTTSVGDQHDISSDGRYVAFASFHLNLVPEDTNDTTDVFVHDRMTGSTRRASVSSDCTEANGESLDASIGADGRHVAFWGLAPNLVPDDMNGFPDIFVHTLPDLLISPFPLDFGPVRVGHTRGPLSLTLTNTRSTDLTVGEISNPDPPFTVEDGTCEPMPFTLAPDESCMLAFSFSPASAGEAETTVTVTSDASESPHTLTLRGIGTTEPLHIGPDPLDFGGVVTGETGGPLGATLTNADEGMVIEVTGVSTPAAPFAESGGTCGEVPFSLDPFATCTIEYTFSPMEEGSFSDVVEVSSDATSGPVSFALQGEGLVRELTVDPVLLDFGGVDVGETAGALSATLTNTGDVVVFVEVATPGAPFTTAKNTCPLFMTPGASCTLSYTFGPTTPGDFDATVPIFSEAPPPTLSLQGTGLGATIDVDPESLSATLGEGENEVRTLTISNSGNVILEWEVVEATGSQTAATPVRTPTAAGGSFAHSQPGKRAHIKGKERRLAGGLDVSDAIDLASELGEALPSLRATQLAGGVVDCDGEPGIVIHDDGTIENAYAGNPFTVNQVTFVDRFTPSAYPASFTAVCVAFASMGPTALDFEVVVLDDDGPGGAPGTELGAVSVSAEGIPGDLDTPAWFSFDISSLFLVIESGSVYIGARWAPSDPNVFITSDESPGNPPGFAGGYVEFDNVGVWEPIVEAVSTEYRSLFVRAVEGPPNPLDCTLPAWVSVSPLSGSVPADEHQMIDVTFDATGLDPGTFEANLCLGSNDTTRLLPAVVPLTVTVTGDAELTFDPPSLDFGDVEVGSTSDAQFTTLSNTGDSDATGLVFTDPGNDFVADTSDCGGVLSAGASCEVSVTFTPVEPGPTSATLEVTSDQDASAGLSLTGTGVSDGVVTPVALVVDPEALLSDGNEVFEPGELIEVAPAWRNDGLLDESFTGTASSFNGADGANYLLPLDDADYGNVEPGATASCLDTGVCYWMGVNDPAARPATHWQATFDETLSEGTTYTWSLHIGDSFLDVPRANPFYPAVETLLHHGVTGGCTATEYCPTGTNTRGQMAVFLLKAVEDADYAPPACGADEEMFTDVPFDSPLCPWIEELADRGVTSGCGGGNYCPGDSVTRAQMAVFLLKAFEGDGYTPPECTGEFTDVACPSTFADWVEELSNREITGGCSTEPPVYCPAAPVTRQQMAVFVTKTFGLTLYGP